MPRSPGGRNSNESYGTRTLGSTAASKAARSVKMIGVASACWETSTAEAMAIAIKVGRKRMQRLLRGQGILRAGLSCDQWLFGLPSCSFPELRRDHTFVMANKTPFAGARRRQ